LEEEVLRANKQLLVQVVVVCQRLPLRRCAGLRPRQQPEFSKPTLDRRVRCAEAGPRCDPEVLERLRRLDAPIWLHFDGGEVARDRATEIVQPVVGLAEGVVRDSELVVDAQGGFQRRDSLLRIALREVNGSDVRHGSVVLRVQRQRLAEMVDGGSGRLAGASESNAGLEPAIAGLDRVLQPVSTHRDSSQACDTAAKDATLPHDASRDTPGPTSTWFAYLAV
jgi:hypothetical protein